MTAPTKTPRVDAWASDNINGPDFIRADDARTLERELTAARAEADELARRCIQKALPVFASTFCTPDDLIARVRAEMEKEKGNG